MWKHRPPGNYQFFSLYRMDRIKLVLKYLFAEILYASYLPPLLIFWIYLDSDTGCLILGCLKRIYIVPGMRVPFAGRLGFRISNSYLRIVFFLCPDLFCEILQIFRNALIFSPAVMGELLLC